MSPGTGSPARPVPAAGFLPDPAAGRLFVTARTVRITDVTADGRIRLDAIARYLQDAATDDVTDAGWDEPQDWLLRKCVVTLGGYPRHGGRVRLRTFCSALGPRWAERTTTLSGADGEEIQARAVWVAVDRETGSPVLLSDRFLRIFGPSAQGRAVSVRLSHPGPDPAVASRPWPLRACDFDPAGHVNNTVAWAAVEDALAGLDWLPASASMEYHQPILPGCEPRLAASRSPGGLDAWLTAGQDRQNRLASARLTR